MHQNIVKQALAEKGCMIYKPGKYFLIILDAENLDILKRTTNEPKSTLGFSYEWHRDLFSASSEANRGVELQNNLLLRQKHYLKQRTA